MATYNNQYAMNIKPATPNLRGISDTYDNTGTNKVSNMGLGELYELDYDRDKIEQVFNQGTDAQYALMQKENQIAENQYANQQFANQQSAIESLRQQRNSQIASGMARGLNAAQEQGTILGLQQDSQAGALELANQRQLEADKIAAEYANNVTKALQEANAVKQAMAQVGATLYEADMLGYTGELSAMAQMDANAVNKYGYDLGYEGTVYSADKNYDGIVYKANKDYEGTKYAADKNYQATVNAASIQAAATKYAASVGGSKEDATVEQYELYKKYWNNKEGFVAELEARDVSTETAAAAWDTYNKQAESGAYSNLSKNLKSNTKDLGNGVREYTYTPESQKIINDLSTLERGGTITDKYGYTHNNINSYANYLLNTNTKY